MKPITTKPALDRERILGDLDILEKEYRKKMREDFTGPYGEFVGVLAGTKIQINRGEFDLGAYPKEPAE